MKEATLRERQFKKQLAKCGNAILRNADPRSLDEAYIRNLLPAANVSVKKLKDLSKNYFPLTEKEKENLPVLELADKALSYLERLYPEPVNAYQAMKLTSRFETEDEKRALLFIYERGWYAILYEQTDQSFQELPLVTPNEHFVLYAPVEKLSEQLYLRELFEEAGKVASLEKLLAKELQGGSLEEVYAKAYLDIKMQSDVLYISRWGL